MTDQPDDTNGGSSGRAERYCPTHQHYKPCGHNGGVWTDLHGWLWPAGEVGADAYLTREDAQAMVDEGSYDTETALASVLAMHDEIDRLRAAKIQSETDLLACWRDVLDVLAITGVPDYTHPRIAEIRSRWSDEPAAVTGPSPEVSDA